MLEVDVYERVVVRADEENRDNELYWHASIFKITKQTSTGLSAT